MKIARITATPVRLPRDIGAATGTAGSPTLLAPGDSDYRFSTVFPCLYSVNFETALVRVETDSDLVGWGEAQAPLAPEVACAIIDRLLGPALTGEDFDGSPLRISALWDRMYSTMRVRGQTGGFMMDAISAIDIALWDLAGKQAGVPIAKLIAASPKASIPAYLSGMPAGSTDTQGFTKVKMFFDTATDAEFFAHMDSVKAEIAVDALWRHTPESAVSFGRELDARGALWFEAPLAPEEVWPHAALARKLKTPVAIGESYRTRYEMAPFFRERAVGVFQPDLGRCGITEGLRLAALAEKHGVPVVPHLSIAFGPQVAAALQFAAAVGNCNLAEYNPQVLNVANRFLAEPIRLESTSYVTPTGPGLGIELTHTP
jgi:D-galactarolactone cycloisomerase